MRESEIEGYLVSSCEMHDVLCDKFTSPGKNAVPDRILAFDGQVLFLELKATGEKPSPAQYLDHAERRRRGLTVCWTDSKEGTEVAVCHIRWPGIYGLPTDARGKVIT